MDRILTIIPRNMIAFVAIVAGILFIVFISPPHTICDSQIEILQTAQQKFLFPDPKAKKFTSIRKPTTKYERLRDSCKLTNDQGGCYEFFFEIRKMLSDLDTVSKECGPTIGGEKPYKDALWETAELIIRFAWGEKPPEAYAAKFGWLDKADMSLFCRLKDKIYAFYGEPSWATFREKMMRELPGAKDLQRNQIWDMSLFSENCAKYP